MEEPEEDEDESEEDDGVAAGEDGEKALPAASDKDADEYVLRVGIPGYLLIIVSLTCWPMLTLPSNKSMNLLDVSVS